MLLLIDIGNTHTHVGLCAQERIAKQIDLPTRIWGSAHSKNALRRFVGRNRLRGAALCSVVPTCTPLVCQLISRLWSVRCLELTPQTLVGLGIDYPKPKTIGQDRLANAVAAKAHFGAPVVVVDFGTAVTFDVIDGSGKYIGGIITPGLAAMTEYLHEKTSLLPRIKIRETRTVIGRSTEQAMLVGAVHGYRGLVRELIGELKKELGARRLPVVATGGYGQLMAAGLPEITAVEPLLTLEGLRITWEGQTEKGRSGGQLAT